MIQAANLIPRVLAGTLLAAGVFAGLWWGPMWFWSIGVALVSALGCRELLELFKARGVQVYRIFGIVMCAIIPLVVFDAGGGTRAGEVLFIVLACFGLFLIQFLRSENPRALEGIALTLFSILYIGWFMSHLIKLRFLPEGHLWVAYLIAVTKSGDIGAYVIGSLFGRHSLIPHISPKKSVEGTVAGLAVSVGVSVAFAGHLPLPFSIPELTLIGLVTGIVAQCGDLSESLIKRYCGAKDSSRIIPGFGGLLDVLDSVLFTAPLFYFFLNGVLA